SDVAGGRQICRTSHLPVMGGSGHAHDEHKHDVTSPRLVAKQTSNLGMDAFVTAIDDGHAPQDNEHEWNISGDEGAIDFEGDSHSTHVNLRGLERDSAQVTLAEATIQMPIMEAMPLSVISPIAHAPLQVVQNSPDIFQPTLPNIGTLTTDCTNKKHKRSASMSSHDDSNQCPICLEPWSSSGSHRVVSIKCGHLAPSNINFVFAAYVKSCIEKWFAKGKKDKTAKCPECNLVGYQKDIRFIWTKNIVAVDTSELESVRQDLREEQSARREVEKEKAKLQLAFKMGESQMLKMEREIKNLRIMNST
ncbi:hypothetical protein BC938DRAFT_477399, partial [Jimgerdemannia flammicorona]